MHYQFLKMQMKIKKGPSVEKPKRVLSALGDVMNFPTKEEFYNHLAQGKDIIYGGEVLKNDFANKQLIKPDNRNSILYSFKNDLSIKLEKNRFGSVGEIKYRLEDISLVLSYLEK